VRVHELAKELGVASKELLASLEVMGYDGQTASSTVPEEAVPRLRAGGGKVKPGSKPKVTAEARAEARPKKRAAKAAEPAPKTAAVGNGKVDSDVAAAVVEPVAAAEPVIRIPEADEPAAAVKVPRGATAQALAERLGTEANAIVKTLFLAGEMVSITQSLSDEAIELVAAELGRPVVIVGAT
jgi:translation initiation factor IF-2